MKKTIITLLAFGSASLSFCQVQSSAKFNSNSEIPVTQETAPIPDTVVNVVTSSRTNGGNTNQEIKKEEIPTSEVMNPTIAPATMSRKPE